MVSDTGLPLRYVLITPARNEEEHIGGLLRSVLAQTDLPLAWVIVSDGSTDRTEELVSEYERRYEWLRLLQRPKRQERHFAAKVEAFNAGFEVVRSLTFDVIGNLDADISFGSDYFAFLMSKFAETPDLGVAGTPFVEQGRHYDYRFTSSDHVSGACQLFRRRCFEDIGGYQPIRGGGIDWLAVTSARMKGWQTRTFTERTCVHHRPIGTFSGGRLAGPFKQGRKDYHLGGHPVWQAFRGVYQMTRPPYVLAGFSLLAGYFTAWIMRERRVVSPELMRFHRGEQLARLRRLFRTPRVRTSS